MMYWLCWFGRYHEDAGTTGLMFNAPVLRIKLVQVQALGDRYASP